MFVWRPCGETLFFPLPVPYTAVASFIDPDWEDKVKSGILMSYRPATLHWQLYISVRDYEFVYSYRVISCMLRIMIDRSAPSVIGGVHIGARAWHLIWFGYIARLSQEGGGGYFIRSNDFFLPAFAALRGGEVSTLWLYGCCVGWGEAGFSTDYKNKSVFSVHLQWSFTSFGYLVMKETKFSAWFYGQWTYFLILKIVPKAASRFLFRLSYSVTRGLSEQISEYDAAFES
jgi:hypothetical protein